MGYTIRLIILFLLFVAGTAAAGAGLSNSTRYFSSGERWNFYQDYTLSIKGASGDSIWLQLSENNSIIKSEIIHIGERFVYSTNLTPADNKTRPLIEVTVKNIYLSSTEDYLVLFDPVYIQGDNGSGSLIPTADNTGTDRTANRPIKSDRFFWILILLFLVLFFYLIQRYR